MLNFKSAVEFTGEAVDVVGVAAIVGGALLAAWRLKDRPAAPYRAFRQDLGRAILLGLELLVAADIIRTVAVAPTLDGVLVLALIVLVRTLLSFSLQVELEGTWPWARGGKAEDNGPPRPVGS